MGRHDEAMNLLDNSIFVKCAPGLMPRLRVLGDPYVSNRQYKSSPGIKTVFSWPVWDYTIRQVRILEKGKSVKDQLDTIEGIHGFSLPNNYDIVVSTTGQGMQTEYRVDGITPVMGELPGQGELDNMLFKLDLAKVSGGIPIGQVKPDNIPQTQVIQGKAKGPAAAAENRPPSQAEYAAARAAEAQAIAAPASRPDTVLTELPDGDPDLSMIPDTDDATTPPINTDDIPF